MRPTTVGSAVLKHLLHQWFDFVQIFVAYLNQRLQIFQGLFIPVHGRLVKCPFQVHPVFPPIVLDFLNRLIEKGERLHAVGRAVKVNQTSDEAGLIQY